MVFNTTFILHRTKWIFRNMPPCTRKTYFHGSHRKATNCSIIYHMWYYIPHLGIKYHPCSYPFTPAENRPKITEFPIRKCRGPTPTPAQPSQNPQFRPRSFPIRKNGGTSRTPHSRRSSVPLPEPGSTKKNGGNYWVYPWGLKYP